MEDHMLFLKIIKERVYPLAQEEIAIASEHPVRIFTIFEVFLLIDLAHLLPLQSLPFGETPYLDATLACSLLRLDRQKILNLYLAFRKFASPNS